MPIANDDTLIVKEYKLLSGNQTYTFKNGNMIGLDVDNIGATDLTVTVYSIDGSVVGPMPISASAVGWSAEFSPFVKVTITSTGSYGIYGRG